MPVVRGPRARAYLAALVVVVPCLIALRLVKTIEARAAAPVLLLAILIVARQWGI